MANEIEIAEPQKQKRKRNDNTIRIAVEVPKINLTDFKVLCNIYGKTQKEMMIRAFNKYVSDRRELVKQFLDLRAKTEEDFRIETAELKEELRQAEVEQAKERLEEN